MKTLLFFLFMLMGIVFYTKAQTYNSDLISVNFEDESVYLSKLVEDDNIIIGCDYTNGEGELIGIYDLSIDAIAIPLDREIETHNFDFYLLDPIDWAAGHRVRTEDMGHATMDDVDKFILNRMNANIVQIVPWFSNMCLPTSPTVTCRINGTYRTKACVCEFISQLSTIYPIAGLPLAPVSFPINPLKNQWYQFVYQDLNSPQLTQNMQSHCTNWGIVPRLMKPTNAEESKSTPITIDELIDNTGLESYNVYNMNGQEMSISSKENLNLLPAGMYVIRTTEKGKVSTYKYMVE